MGSRSTVTTRRSSPPWRAWAARRGAPRSAAVAGMARALRLTTIAEGVENLDQLQALKRLGCDLAQGYFFTTPQPPSHINRLLESDRGLPLFHYDDNDAVPTQRGAVG